MKRVAPVCLLFVLCAVPAVAATVAELIPSSAPRGARVILTGQELGTGNLAVTFSSTSGPTPAAIVQRTPAMVELIVPVNAVSGDVRVTNGGAVLGTLHFSVAEPAGFAAVKTLNAGQLKTPAGLCVRQTDGALLVADSKNHRVVAVSPGGTLQVLAGTGQPGLKNGPAAGAELKQPSGIAADALRDVIYVADTGNHVIRRIEAGMVTTLAGSGKPGDRDGSGADAEFREPSAITLDAAGNIYVADKGNHKIRIITPQGAVMTFAGAGRPGYADGAAAGAQFKEPQGLTIAADGALYVADTLNYVIRKIQNGVVSTVAGTTHPGSLDGPGNLAEFGSPAGLSADEGWNLYLADAKSDVVRRIDLTQSPVAVTTLAGSGRNGFADGAPLAAQFKNPGAVAAAGPVYVSDSMNDALRVILPNLRLTDLYPRNGSSAGGNEIRIFGSGFIPGNTEVFIGGAPAPEVVVVTSTELIATVPAHSSGSVDVVVSTSAGSATLAGRYSYLQAPAITSVVPAKGRTAGGDIVTVRGTDFGDGIEFLFGSAPAQTLSVESTSAATVRTPAGTAGPVTVVARTSSGEGQLANAFLYVAPPVITSFTPGSGGAGTAVRIQGNNFDENASGNIVRFAGVQAQVLAVTSTEIQTAVPNGAQSGKIEVTTAGGTASSPSDYLIATYTSLRVAPSAMTLTIGTTGQLTATATMSDGTTQNVSAAAQWTAGDSRIATVSSTGLVQALAPGTTSITARFLGFSAVVDVQATTNDTPPPDPASVAPPADSTHPTVFSDSVAFLYSGPNAIQKGVTPGAIVERRIAVIRGRVVDAGGAAVAGVRVSAVGSSATGYTLSREDGFYDLVVNGGGTVVLSFDKNGWIPVHRHALTTWQAFTALDDTTVIPYDSQVTAIDLPQISSLAVARGSSIHDEDGDRRATMLFQPGTAASMKLPNGATQSLTNIHVRATEQTVGEKGAMPAELPPASGYTYCVELSVDEAVAAGASRVEFSKPVFLYVENFLGFAVGSPVPVGYYDREKAEWIASDNGVVIKILGVNGGVADVDTDGDGSPDSGAGLTDAERQSLGSLYQAGQSLWRIAVTHFTPWDGNWPYTPPEDAVFPSMPIGAGNGSIESPACQAGSIIECENLTLGKTVPVGGTPFTLEYSSRRAPGYTVQRRFTVALTPGQLPASVKRVDVELVGGGKRLTGSFSSALNQKQTFTWDGNDVYGRKYFAQTSMNVRIGYVYDGVYRRPADFYRAFAAFSAGPITGIRSRNEVVLWQEYDVPVSGSAPDQGLGGWNLNAVHSYDPGAKALTLGSGTTFKMEARGLRADRAATSITGFEVRFIKAGPDGSVYSFGDSGAVKRIAPDGTISTVAGGGTTPAGDGVPAVGSNVHVIDMAVHPSGDLVLLDAGAGKIYRVRNGVLRQVGSGTSLSHVTVMPDGSIYYIDDYSLMKIDGGGNVSTVIQQRDQDIMVTLVRAGADGVLYADVRHYVINWGFQGFVGSIEKLSGSLWSAVLANYNHYSIGDIAVDASGKLYYSYSNSGGYYNPEMNVNVIESDGSGHPLAVTGPKADAYSMALLPDGRLVYTTLGSLDMCDPLFRQNMRCIVLAGSPVALSTGGGFTATTPAGTEGYKFSILGKHVESRQSLSGSLLYRFGYEGHGLLSTVEDGDGLITRIERAANGQPQAIIAPNGDRTDLQLDADGRLSDVNAPGAQNRHFTYTTGGLLETYRDPRGATTTYGYDAEGRLARAADAGQGSKTLTHTIDGNLETTQLSTAGGRTWQYTVRRLDPSSLIRTVTDPTGAQLIANISEKEARVQRPDGTTITAQTTPDPQWGAMAPFASSSQITLPSGRMMTLTRTRTTTLSDVLNPLSVVFATETTTVNGRPFKATYTASSRNIRFQSPMGRAIDQFLDSSGRMASASTPGLAPVTMSYDARGRIASVMQGSRKYVWQWNDRDQVASITDPLQRTMNFTYDAAGRLVSEALPGGRSLSFAYDPNGNVVSITPSGRSAHGLTFNGIGLLDAYAPPAGAATRYVYNADRDLTQIIRPDNSTVEFSYAAGRPARISTPMSVLTFGYDEAGRLSTLADSAGVALQFGWDGFLPAQNSWSGAVSGSVTWSYDSEMRLASESVNGDSASYAYDADSLLTNAGAEVLARDASNGRLTGTTLGGVTDSVTYNTTGEVTRYAARYAGTDLFTIDYGRDAAGRVATKTETIAGVAGSPVTYDYDTAGRLLRVSVTGTIVAEYDYDANGNRTAHRWAGGSNSGTYDGEDRLLTYGNATYVHSPNGELASKTLGGQTTTYQYDALGNLRRVSTGSGFTVDYIADGKNRRIGKKINGTLVKGWLYGNQLRVIAELDGQGAIVSRFVYGSKSNVPDYMVKQGVTYRILSDQTGSPRLVVNTTDGTIAQRIDYDPFGAILSDTNPGFQPFGFAGGLYDPDTGLVRFGARDYDPQTGRFTAKDPVLFAGGSANLYAYSFGDPINFVDPNGMLTIPLFGWVDVGENAGTAALGTYADVLTDPESAWYEIAGAAVGGFFSALWTPCTSDATFATLSAAYTANSYVGRPFYQYYPGNNPAYNSRWLTRGKGWGSPYTLGDEAARNLALPPYNPAGAVREVPSSWRYFASGPRTVAPGYGMPGGGIEYFQGWRFPN